MKKTKKDYYGNLIGKDVTDNKRFWKTVKPLLSDKVKTFWKNYISTWGQNNNNDEENANVLNSFFSSVVNHLKIPEFKGIDFSAECISLPALKAIMKFGNHSSVSVIKFQFLKSKCWWCFEGN